jgi:hypothetical protein
MQLHWVTCRCRRGQKREGKDEDWGSDPAQDLVAGDNQEPSIAQGKVNNGNQSTCTEAAT